MSIRYKADYGMFRFCIVDTEHDWRVGTEQYKFIEQCLSTTARQKQPWQIFAAYCVLSYSYDKWYGLEGSFEEPMGSKDLQKLWQIYKVDIAFYGHVHNYERSCPIYQGICLMYTFNICLMYTFNIHTGIQNCTLLPLEHRSIDFVFISRSFN